MNVLTTAASGSILFDSGTAGGSTHTDLSAAVELSYDGVGGIDITSHVPGETDRFNVRGSSGTLFSVNDALTGTVFSVNDASGLPIIEVNSDATTDTIAIGEYGTNALFVSGGNVGVGTVTPTANLEVGALTSGQTGRLKVNHEGGILPVASFKSRTNKAIVEVSDNDTTGYVSSENGLFSLGRNAGVNAANININASNNVGIGTSSPQAALHVSGAIGNTPAGTAGVLMGLNANYGNIQLNGTCGAYIDFSTSGTDWQGRILYCNASNYMRFDTSQAEKMRLNSTGLGIGTTSPSAKLHVAGQIMISPSSGTPSLKFQDSGSTNAYIDLTDSQQRFDFRDDSDTVMSIKLDTLRVGIGTTNPSYKLDVNGSSNSTSLHVNGINQHSCS